jgi:hypothetical protein
MTMTAAVATTTPAAACAASYQSFLILAVFDASNMPDGMNNKPLPQ